MPTPPPVPDRPPTGAGGAPAAPPVPPEGGATVDEVGEQTAVREGFFQKSWVQNVLPFVTSIAVHAGIILIGILGYTTYTVVQHAMQEQIIVPDSAIVEGAPVGGVKFQGLGGDPNRKAYQDKYKDVAADSQGFSDSKETVAAKLMDGGGAGGAEGAISLGVNTGFGTGAGTGGGEGTGLGTGAGGSGGLAPFGVPGGGGLGPKSPFLGISGNATRIAYVCDASGSMQQRFDELRVEIRKALDVLKPIQAFSVIFFQADMAASVAPQLLPATPDNKRKAFKFLDETTARSETDPIPALKLAFDQHPQLIYLLTDGEFNDNDKVVAFINERNRDKKVKINTIAFITRSNEDPSAVLKRIAAENGGQFKRVGSEYLGD